MWVERARKRGEWKKIRVDPKRKRRRMAKTNTKDAERAEEGRRQRCAGHAVVLVDVRWYSWDGKGVLSRPFLRAALRGLGPQTHTHTRAKQKE